MHKQTAHIIFHCFYPDFSKDLEIISQLQEQFNLRVYINNISNRSIDRNQFAYLQQALVYRLPNLGKDLLSKLFFLQHILAQKQYTKDDLVLFLHDKKSPQAMNGKEWKQKLFKITEPQYLRSIKEQLRRAPGLACSKESWMSASDLTSRQLMTHNAKQVNEIAHQLQLAIKDQSFVGGTMFWANLFYFEKIATHLDISQLMLQLEEGNVLDLQNGSYTHAWERILSYLVTNQEGKHHLI